MIVLKFVKDSRKKINIRQTRNSKHSQSLSKFGKHIAHEVSKYKNKRFWEYNIITERKSFTFENNIHNEQKFKPQFKKCRQHDQMQKLQYDIHRFHWSTEK